jgi:hypothetical protein
LSSAVTDPVRFCHHCGKSHQQSEMVLVSTRTGRRWRCRESLQAARMPPELRDAYGRHTSLQNRERQQRALRLRHQDAAGA